MSFSRIAYDRILACMYHGRNRKDAPCLCYDRMVGVWRG